LNAVVDDGGQIAQQRLETMDLKAILGRLGHGLALGGLGALRGRNDGAACSPALSGIVIIEQNRRQQAAHMPLDVVSEHAEQDVSADAIRQAMVNGPDVEVNRLQAAKGAFNARQIFVAGF